MRIRRHNLNNPQGPLRAEDLPKDESLKMLSATLMSTAGVDPKLSHDHLVATSEHIHLDATEDISMIMSASNSSPSVNWLDRLRAAKGFPPVDPNLDISDFLLSATELGCADHKDVASELGCADQGAVACLKQDSLNSSHIFQEGCNGSSKKHGSAAGFSSSSTHACDVGNAGVVAESESGRSNISVTDARSQNESSSSSKEGNIAGECFLHIPHQNEAGGALKKSSLSCHDSKEDAGLSQLYFNMFADLFCMEVRRPLNLSPSMEPGKKQHRKQDKPKPCSNFTDADPRCDVVPSSQLQTHEFDSYPTHETNSSNPISQLKELPEEKLNMPDLPSNMGEDEKSSLEQKKTSNTNTKKKDTVEPEERRVENEILVIDTSLTGWKVEKIIFRKGKGWKIKNKGVSATDSMTECLTRIAKEQAKVPQVSNTRREVPIKVQTEQDLIGVRKEKSNEDSNRTEGLDSIQQHVIKVWKTTPHTHARSSRKRKRSEPVGDERLPEKIELDCVTNEPEPSEKAMNFAFDHPANQPKEGLFHSIYQVFTQAGRAGLTAREAVSRILEQGLPGLHEGGVAPRVEVLKIVSNSPYFMPLEESKYILCSALVGDEEPHKDVQNSGEMEDDNKSNCMDIVKPAKQHGVSQYWAACTAIRRARTGNTRRKPSSESSFLNNSVSHEAHQVIAELASKKRLKCVKQDSTGLGNRCNRSDGKGWHCPLRAKVGYLLCDHHLDRLRTRVKSHIKSRMLSITKGSKEEREQRLGGSWAVKTVVERSRIAKHPHADDDVDQQQNSMHA